MKAGLATTTILATAMLALIIAISFGVLVYTVVSERESIGRAQESQEVLILANNIERRVVDLETGERGFLLTGEPSFLEPWNAAQQDLPRLLDDLESMVADNPEQADRADNLVDEITAYVVEYSVPLVNGASADLGPQELIDALEEGKRRFDSIRSQFDDFTAAQTALVATERASEDAQAGRAVTLAIAGLGLSMGIMVVYVVFLRRAIVRPITSVAALARRRSTGETGVRMPETGMGEIGDLERSFNTMSESLDASRADLEQYAIEQAVLRQIATQVAQGRPADEVFAAVAEGMARVFDADISTVHRFEGDGSMSTVGVYGMAADVEGPVGASYAELLRLAEAPGRLDFDDQASEAGAEAAGELGIRSLITGEIVVDGRPWGLIAAASRDRVFAPEAERRKTGFSELVATAVASTQSKSELIASRARIVAASDATRRKIERDLHDGAQQRLVTLGLELHNIRSTLPEDLLDARRQLEMVGDGIEGVLEELREISRGIHPAVLTQGGLVTALRALARRSPVPVELEVGFEERLPEPLEVAAYYIAAEALTNAAKHARAGVVEVRIEADDSWVSLSVHDDGVGGADTTRGSGLVGLRDRAAALGGHVDIISPRGKGTTLTARLPIG